MSDTPRTDAEVAGISWFVTDSDQRAYSATDYECLRDFARALERENASLREALEAFMRLRTDARGFTVAFTTACLGANMVLAAARREKP